jgi:hypothetical protein
MRCTHRRSCSCCSGVGRPLRSDAPATLLVRLLRAQEDSRHPCHDMADLWLTADSQTPGSRLTDTVSAMQPSHGSIRSCASFTAGGTFCSPCLLHLCWLRCHPPSLHAPAAAPQRHDPQRSLPHCSPAASCCSPPPRPACMPHLQPPSQLQEGASSSSVIDYCCTVVCQSG